MTNASPPKARSRPSRWSVRRASTHVWDAGGSTIAAGHGLAPKQRAEPEGSGTNWEAVSRRYATLQHGSFCRFSLEAVLSQAEATFVPPAPDQVPQALGDLERFLHGGPDLPTLVSIGLTHAQFETIHPFLDGNGRIGRLLITFLIVRARDPEQAGSLPLSLPQAPPRRVPRPPVGRPRERRPGGLARLLPARRRRGGLRGGRDHPTRPRLSRRASRADRRPAGPRRGHRPRSRSASGLIARALAVDPRPAPSFCLPRAASPTAPAACAGRRSRQTKP
jgi:hypothetical protein